LTAPKPSVLERNLRILLVDDNPAIHEDYRKILGDRSRDTGLVDLEAELFGPSDAAQAGPVYELESAYQGKEALEKVREARAAGRRYAMAFMDVRMPPGWNGVETTKHIWAEDPDLEVVICTAYSDLGWSEIVAEVDDWSPGGSQPYGRAFWPISAAVLLPVLGTGLGFRAVSRRASAKLVNRTMYVTLFGSLLVAQLMLVFLPAVISLAVAAFQVRKAEVLAASAAASDGASGDVIDVDEVPAEKASMDKLGVDVVDADEIIEVGEVPSDDASDRG